MERLPLTLRTALYSGVNIQMCGFLYEQRMGGVQLAVMVTRIEVMFPEILSEQKPNGITAMIWVKISSSRWLWWFIFNLNCLTDPVQMQPHSSTLVRAVGAASEWEWCLEWGHGGTSCNSCFCQSWRFFFISLETGGKHMGTDSTMTSSTWPLGLKVFFCVGLAVTLEVCSACNFAFQNLN